MKRVAVVGLGLIGGSVALSLRRHNPQLEVVAIDRRDVLDAACAEGFDFEFRAVEEGSNPSSLGYGCDLVVLAIPVRAIAECLADWLALGCPITDCGSTKAAPVEAVRGHSAAGRYVPGHPMAGREVGGLRNASAELFTGRPWLLCPEGSDVDALATVTSLIQLVGAQRVDLSVAEHDRAVALTSHVPQLLASWLADAAAQRGAALAAGPAFADMTRIAGGAESMWRDIFATNATSIAEVLDLGVETLGEVARALRQQPPSVEPALALLERARGQRT